MILLTPGPTPIPPLVQEAMSQPIIPHRSMEFERLYGECAEGLREVFRTKSPVMLVTGSGTTAMEAALLSLVKAGDSVVTCANGKFGRRWQEVYDRVPHPLKISNTKISASWGDAVAPERLAQSLQKLPYVSVVALTHSETSTGVANDLKEMAAVVRKHSPDALVVADGITSVGAIPMEADGWGVDVVVSASQKAFMLPPGLGFVMLSERARARLGSIRHGESLAPLSMDLRAYLAAHEKGSTPYT
ncbi:MAG: aminotransferase class V-fold PLP-dependent enzyme, partial [Planctomycetota bacterium]|nr:aminotransferase class V-fold PLP-dependent enzyme [Planctomycetota bacterium]